MSNQINTPVKIAQSTTVSLTTLQLWDRNPRSIKGERFNELKDRLKRQGQIKPLLVAADGITVIGGNMRLRAMQELGIQEVWISQTEAVTDKDIFDLALTDNEEFGYYEQEQVAELALELGLSTLELKSYSLSLGAPTTLDLVIDKFGPEPEEDEVPEVDATETISGLGEVYKLGSHRLMCGDSTDADAVAELMDGAKADMVFTDPPYGIKRDKGFGGAGGFGKPIARTQYEGDWDSDIPPQECFDMMLDLAPKVIIFGGNFFAHLLPQGKHWIVWDKKNTMPTFGDAELAWTNIERDSVKIKEFEYNGLIGKEKEQRQHATQKPLGLIQSIVKDYTNGGELVVDIFGGSGTCLIACEQTNRICYMMELDPKYVDVIRKRYAKHIGEEESWQTATPLALSNLVEA